MQVVSNTRRLARVLNPIRLKPPPDLTSAPEIGRPLTAAPPRQWHLLDSFSSLHSPPLPLSSSVSLENSIPSLQKLALIPEAHFCSEASPVESSASDVVKEFYDKIVESVNVKRNMSPNAWLWTVISNCQIVDDVNLLFDALQNLRRFRLSNLRIHDNFNSHLCLEISKACIRAGAIDFGKKSLWKHNVYGLTPAVGFANHLLSYAKDQKDTNLLTEVLKLMKKNGIELQPSTADIVFSACADLDDWELISKYSKRFVRAGVKLRRTSFDVWMNFAAKRGNTKALWKIEKLRPETANQHTVVSGFACAKGFILDRRPQDAASVIQTLYQTLPETKKSGIGGELQNLVSEWPLDVVKYHEGENRKALDDALKSDIPSMVAILLSTGIERNVADYIRAASLVLPTSS